MLGWPLNSKGISIVGVLVAVGITGIVIAGITTVLMEGQNAQQFVRQRQAALTMQMTLTEFLSDRTTCQTNFTGLNVIATPDSNKASLVNASNGVVFQTNNTYENGTLRLNRIRVFNWRPRAANGPDRYRGSMDVVFSFSKIGNNLTGGLSALNRSVQLAVELKGFTVGLANPDQIQSCVAVGNDANQPWRITAAQDIFFDVGDVGIGISSPTQRLQVNGYVLALGYLYPSDARLKTEITPSPGLEIVSKIQGVRYRRISDQQYAYGVIAQDLETVMPEAVSTDPSTGLKSVDYLQIIGPLVRSTQELEKGNQDLKLRLTAQAMEIEYLKEKIKKKP